MKEEEEGREERRVIQVGNSVLCWAQPWCAHTYPCEGGILDTVHPSHVRVLVSVH